MSKRHLNRLAAGALLASLLCLLVSFLSGNTMRDTSGALSLGVVGDTLWIADQENILVANDQGQERRRFALKTMGLKHPPGAILSVSSDRVLLIERFSDKLVEFDPVSGKPLRAFSLQWPQGFSGNDEVVMAATTPLDASGHYDLAVSTGGMHAVLLFDSDGRFKARSKDGAYRFTNGIWFSPEGWWTTDTNRFFLRRLKLDSLEELANISLDDRHGDQVFLGLATPYPPPAPLSTSLIEPPPQPLATVFRHQNGMSIGRVVDVFADGHEETYPLRGDAKLVDLAWFGGNLLVIEGQEQRVRSFAPDRTALPDFGDAALQRYYGQVRTAHARAALLNRLALIAAVLGLGIGLLCSFVAKQKAQGMGHLPEPGSEMEPPIADDAERPTPHGQQFQQCIGSACLPGLGQWMQRRNAVALMFFVPFAGWLSFAVTPLIWTYLGHRAEIPRPAFVLNIAVWLSFALVASLEAWHHSQSPARREVRR